MLYNSLLFYVLAAITLVEADNFGLERRHADVHRYHGKRAAYSLGAWSGTSSLANGPRSGVSAQQMTVVGNNKVLILDKAEKNPLKVNGKSVWVSYLDLPSGKVKGMFSQTNSFCAAGSFLSNGTMLSLGGTPSTTHYGDGNGLQAVRMFPTCDDSSCNIYENQQRLRLSSKRWYPGTSRLPDGSVFIMGGMVTTGFNNAPSTDNPTIEYFPPKNIAGYNGLQIPSKFLKDALNTNLFPFITVLPDGRLFVVANSLSMIYNWKTNTEQRTPNMPNGVIVNYPWSAGSALLPLTPDNNYTPEVMFCGGSVPYQNPNINAWETSSQAKVGTQCARMQITSAGIKKGWAVEQADVGRVMATAVLTPDGKVLFVGGAHTGLSGYDNAPNKIGSSNADNPVFYPSLYDPAAPRGKRFSSNFPSSKIPRLYHSTATLLPDGRVMYAGSNPNDDVQTRKYPTEYRIEYLSPPYMRAKRPTYSGLPSNIFYGQNFNLNVKLPSSGKVTVALMDLGFTTHGITYNMRSVGLVNSLSADKSTLTVTGPPNVNIYPPGPAYLYVLVNGVPSQGYRVMVGDGSSPPTDENARRNMLARTSSN